MIRRVFFVFLASLGLTLTACDAQAPADAQPEEQSAPAVAEAAKPDGPSKAAERLAEKSGPLHEAREIAAAYAAGELGDRLVTGDMLLVDARAPAGTDQVQFFVLDGPLTTPPAKVSELRATGGRDPGVRWHLLGGMDGNRPAVFRGIAQGTYTVCAVVGPPTSPEKAAQLAKMEALYKAEHGDKLDAEKLKEVADRVKAESDEPPEAIDWDALPLRCKQADVTAAADSRVVVLEQA